MNIEDDPQKIMVKIKIVITYSAFREGGGGLRVCIILYLLIINKAVYYYILYLELGKDYLAKVHTFKFAFKSIFLNIHELLLKTVRIGVSCWIFFSGFSVLLSLWYFDFSVLGYPLD